MVTGRGGTHSGVEHGTAEPAGPPPPPRSFPSLRGEDGSRDMGCTQRWEEGGGLALGPTRSAPSGRAELVDGGSGGVAPGVQGALGHSTVSKPQPW